MQLLAAQRREIRAVHTRHRAASARRPNKDDSSHASGARCVVFVLNLRRPTPPCGPAHLFSCAARYAGNATRELMRCSRHCIYSTHPDSSQPSFPTPACLEQIASYSWTSTTYSFITNSRSDPHTFGNTMSWGFSVEGTWVVRMLIFCCRWKCRHLAGCCGHPHPHLLRFPSSSHHLMPIKKKQRSHAYPTFFPFFFSPTAKCGDTGTNFQNARTDQTGQDNGSRSAKPAAKQWLHAGMPKEKVRRLLDDL